MPGLSLLIKPASGACNMRCAYCFYADVAANRHVGDYGMMRRDTAETIIRRGLSEAGHVTFSFQGGEPTLWGLDNFRFFVETAGRLRADLTQANAEGPPGKGKTREAQTSVNYALQTNGILLDEAWAAFFAEHGFLIGLSLDGYKDLHDANRLDAGGRGTYGRALKAAALLRKAGAQFNILSVVTAGSAVRGEKLYRFYQNQNLGYLQFIPCIDDFGSEGRLLDAAGYGRHLKTMFDMWYRDVVAGRGISIRYFDNLLSMYMGYPPELCSMDGACHIQFVVEADGGVYPCDFYVLDQWRLGNVHEDSFGAMLASRTAGRFIAESARHPACGRCRWFALCRGGCKRDREPLVEGVPSANRFCEAYKDFFAYSHERFGRLAHMINRDLRGPAVAGKGAE